MELKNLCLGGIAILLILVIISAFTGTGSTTNQVTTTVNGVDFILNDNAQITVEDGSSTGFKIKDDIHGYIQTISDSTLNSYIQNDTDTDYFVMKSDSFNEGASAYSFIEGGNIDKGYYHEGYFLVFQKDNKNFIYLIENDKSSTDSEIEFMAKMMWDFTTDNKDLKPI